MARDTRHRILVASLLLFNEHGVPRTTINDIADEIDISPGNLHYHFRKKEEIVDALTAEFQADARKLLVAADDDTNAIDEFWGFLHLLLETLVAYRFLFRDSETLRMVYPHVARALAGFAKGLTAATEFHVQQLCHDGVVEIADDDVAEVCRNIVVATIFFERFEGLAGRALGGDQLALGIARSVLSILLPHATPDSAPLLAALTEPYRR